MKPLPSDEKIYKAKTKKLYSFYKRMKPFHLPLHRRYASRQSRNFGNSERAVRNIKVK